MTQRVETVTDYRRTLNANIIPDSVATTLRWLCCGVCFTFLTCGCGKSDLSGYRPLDKSNTKTEVDTVQETKQASISKSEDDGDSVDSDATKSEVIDETLPVSAMAPLNVVDGANVGSLLKMSPTDVASKSEGTATPSTPPANSTTAAEPRKVEILIPEKTFRPDGASKALRVSYDDLDLLKVMNMEPVTVDAVEQMPGWLKGLSGQKIRIRGFMYPTFETEGIERFVLARDNQICCFGRDPKVYDLVQVDLRSGKTTNYIPATRAFDVIGRLKIEMVSEGDKPFGLYFLEDAEVIDR